MLLTGGYPGEGRSPQASAEVYGPRAGRFTAVGAVHSPRADQSATLLADGRVLVAGGTSGTDGRGLLDSTEVLDLGAATSRAGPRLSEGEYKLDGAVATFSGGRVVIAGGSLIDVYDASNNRIRTLNEPPVPRRSFVTVTPIGPNTVLVAGGYDATITPTADVRVFVVP